MVLKFRLEVCLLSLGGTEEIAVEGLQSLKTVFLNMMNLLLRENVNYLENNDKM